MDKGCDGWLDICEKGDGFGAGGWNAGIVRVGGKLR